MRGRAVLPPRRAQQGQDGADVGGELEADELVDVRVDGAPFTHGTHDGGEVVVGEHHVGDFLGHVGPGDSHGHADMCGPQRCRVVDAVTGHGDDMAPLGQRPHDGHLVLRDHAGEHADLLDAPGELPWCHPVELHARHHVSVDVQLARDGRRGVRVVTGDHLDGHPRRAAQGDRVPCLRARWIGDSGDGHQGRAGQRYLIGHTVHDGRGDAENRQS